MKKILYFGPFDQYITSIQDDILKTLGEDVIECHGPETSAKKIISLSLESTPEIIIFDYLFFRELPHNFMSVLRNCPEFKLSAILCVVPFGLTKEIGKKSALGDVTYFIKSFEIVDILYLIKSLLYPQAAQASIMAKAFYMDKIELESLVRIVHLTRDYALLETNVSFADNSMQQIAFPFHKNLIRSPHQKMMKKSENDIQSHFRYNYQMEYSFFPSTIKREECLKLLETFRYDIRQRKMNDLLFKAMLENTKKPAAFAFAEPKAASVSAEDENPTLTELNLVSKGLLFNWIIDNVKPNNENSEKIVIYDRTYHLMGDTLKNLEEKNVLSILRHHSVDPAKEILKDRPAILVFAHDEVNNIDVLKKLVFSFTQVIDYFPFVLVFNFNSMSVEELRDKLEYHFVLSTKVPVTESVIIKFLSVYREKKLARDQKKAKRYFQKVLDKESKFIHMEESTLFDHQVSFKIEQQESLFYFKLPIEVIWISELELIFSCTFPLAIGDIFKISNPTEMQLMVLPHIEGSKESKLTNTYRALIHWMQESEKESLRRFINSVAKMNGIKNSSLTSTEIRDIKKQYFTI